MITVCLAGQNVMLISVHTHTSYLELGRPTDWDTTHCEYMYTLSMT